MESSRKKSSGVEISKRNPSLDVKSLYKYRASEIGDSKKKFSESNHIEDVEKKKRKSRKEVTQPQPLQMQCQMRFPALHLVQSHMKPLASLNSSTSGTKLKLPRYDKSSCNGRGDRADPSTWPEVEGPLTVLVIPKTWVDSCK